MWLAWPWKPIKACRAAALRWCYGPRRPISRKDFSCFFRRGKKAAQDALQLRLWGALGAFWLRALGFASSGASCDSRRERSSRDERRYLAGELGQRSHSYIL